MKRKALKRILSSFLLFTITWGSVPENILASAIERANEHTLDSPYVFSEAPEEVISDNSGLINILPSVSRSAEISQANFTDVVRTTINVSTWAEFTGVLAGTSPLAASVSSTTPIAVNITAPITAANVSTNVNQFFENVLIEGAAINFTGGANTVTTQWLVVNGGTLLLSNTIQRDTGNITADGGTAGSRAGQGITITNGGNFQLLDGALIRGFRRGVHVVNGTFNMLGGAITGNQALANYANSGGAGVRVSGSSSSFNMFGGRIHGNRHENPSDANSRNSGGVGVRVDTGAVFNMHGGIIENNRTNGGSLAGFSSGISTRATGSGGGVNVNQATFNMFDGLIDNNHVTAGGDGAGSAGVGGGGVAVVGNNSHFNMSGGSIVNNSRGFWAPSFGESAVLAMGAGAGTGGGGLFLVDGASAHLSGGEIAGNYSRRGGGIAIQGHATNSANTGATWNASNRSTLIIDGSARIHHNVATEGRHGTSGGGIFVGPHSDVIMNGGIIERNIVANNINADAANGGGIRVAAAATFTMNEGIIRENVLRNRTTAQLGTTGINGFSTVITEALSASSASSLTGTVANTHIGGGVSVRSDAPANPGRFTMNGGRIENNLAGRGGGIGMNANGFVTIYGGYIENNRAVGTGTGASAAGGGGIATFENTQAAIFSDMARLRIYPYATIRNNTSSDRHLVINDEFFRRFAAYAGRTYEQFTEGQPMVNPGFVTPGHIHAFNNSDIHTVGTQTLYTWLNEVVYIDGARLGYRPTRILSTDFVQNPTPAGQGIPNRLTAWAPTTRDSISVLINYGQIFPVIAPPLTGIYFSRWEATTSTAINIGSGSSIPAMGIVPLPASANVNDVSILFNMGTTPRAIAAHWETARRFANRVEIIPNHNIIEQGTSAVFDARVYSRYNELLRTVDYMEEPYWEYFWTSVDFEFSVHSSFEDYITFERIDETEDLLPGETFVRWEIDGVTARLRTEDGYDIFRVRAATYRNAPVTISPNYAILRGTATNALYNENGTPVTFNPNSLPPDYAYREATIEITPRPIRTPETIITASTEPIKIYRGNSYTIEITEVFDIDGNEIDLTDPALNISWSVTNGLALSNLTVSVDGIEAVVNIDNYEVLGGNHSVTIRVSIEDEYVEKEIPIYVLAIRVPTTIIVTPRIAAVMQGYSHNFTYEVLDQFGDPYIFDPYYAHLQFEWVNFSDYGVSIDNTGIVNTSRLTPAGTIIPVVVRLISDHTIYGEATAVVTNNPHRINLSINKIGNNGAIGTQTINNLIPGQLVRVSVPDLRSFGFARDVITLDENTILETGTLEDDYFYIRIEDNANIVINFVRHSNAFTRVEWVSNIASINGYTYVLRRNVDFNYIPIAPTAPTGYILTSVMPSTSAAQILAYTPGGAAQDTQLIRFTFTPISDWVHTNTRLITVRFRVNRVGDLGLERAPSEDSSFFIRIPINR
ncbi:MAG: hypothetical protein FWF50_06455, partial [Defluviitaleaceae bacterium]|nr:hypothetical protein [Defluviitaleaceae bacterium]